MLAITVQINFLFYKIVIFKNQLITIEGAMPSLAAAICGNTFCHDGEVHGSTHEGGDHFRGRPSMGDTTMKLYKKYTASLNQNLECFGTFDREAPIV